jgi:probable F420-dependent oxidoreductase
MEALDLPFPGGAARPPLVIGAYSQGLMRLAGSRSAGLLTVLVDPNHTARARGLLGPDPFLAVSQFAIVETDWPTVLELGRSALRYYLKLPHQLRKFRALGFTDEDLEPPGSERLVDAMIAWGDPAQVRTRLQRHFDAGADHVAVGILASHDQVAEQLAQLTLA